MSTLSTGGTRARRQRPKSLAPRRAREVPVGRVGKPGIASAPAKLATAHAARICLSAAAGRLGRYRSDAWLLSGRARFEASLRSVPRPAPSGCGRSRPRKLVSGGARSSRPLCPFPSWTGGGSQGDRSNLDGGVSSHSPRRRTVTLERFERGVVRSPLDLKRVAFVASRRRRKPESLRRPSAAPPAARRPEARPSRPSATARSTACASSRRPGPSSCGPRPR